jgi:hypothetical protein
MKNTAQAKIVWTPRALGRRNLIPPERHIIPARFEDEADQQPQPVWSLCIEITEAPGESGETTATIWLLVGDEPNAPNHLLHPGSRFELFEGYNIVARGQVFSLEA